MVATAKEYNINNPNIIIQWDKRPLQAFADRPIELMVYDYDMVVVLSFCPVSTDNVKYGYFSFCLLTFILHVFATQYRNG